MSVDDLVKRELAKLKVSQDKIAEAEQNVSDMKGFGFDVNLLTVLLADGAVNKQQVNYIMERAQMDEGSKTSVIAQLKTVEKALSALPGAKQTLILTNKSVDSETLETPFDANTEVDNTEKSIGKTAAKKTVPRTPQKVPPKKTGKSRYVDFKPLGEGGMGVVYKVFDTLMDRIVAMKTIRPEITGDRLIIYLSRFRNEVQTTANLEHEGIVRGYDVGKGKNGQTYLTMEFVKGESLEDVLDKIHFDRTEFKKELEEKEKRIKDYLEQYEQGNEKLTKELEKIEQQKTPEAMKKLLQEREDYLKKYPIREIMRLFEQASRAVGYANSKGYIHRDIKPPNIMIKAAEGKEPNKAKLMDWGVAINMKDPTPKYVEGTPHYMGPEQAGGEKQSPLFDVYSLGATLYKILTNRTPFDGEDADKIMLKIVDKTRIATHPAKFKGLKDKPPELCEIAMKAINKDAKLRYQSADALADDIRAWLEYKPTTAYTETRKEWLKRNDKRRPWVKYTAAIMAGITALGLAIGGPILYMSESKARQKTKQAQEQTIKTREAEKGKQNAEQDKQKAQEEERKAKEEKERAEREQAKKAEIRREALNEYDKGRDFLKRKDFENAERYFDKAISIDDLADAHFEKGLSLYSRFRGFDAVTEFESANNSSIKESKKIHAQALFYAGFVNIDHLDNPQKAGQYFQELIAKATDDDDYFVILAKSLSAFSEDRFEEAIQWADSATEKYKNCWEGWLLKAVYRMQGVYTTKSGLFQYRDFPTAFKSLDKALELNPGQMRCLEQRIKLNCATSRPQAALKDATYLVETYPDVPAVRASLGLVQYALGNYKASIKTLDTAITLQRQIGVESPPTFFIQGLNYQRLAEQEQNVEYYKKSEEFFSQSVKLSNRHPEHLAYRASIRLKLKNPEGALEDLNEAIKKDPRDGKTHCTFGLYYAEQGETEKAISEFEKAISVQFDEAYRELGLYYITLGEKEKAKQALQTYIDIGMTDKRAEIIQKIKDLEKE